jgi:hypothetical protein
VEIADLGSALAELHDKELIFHGFTPYMRDYEMVVYEPVDPNPKYGLVPRHLRFLFRHCTEATVTSRVRPEVWSRSLSDELLKVRHVSRDATGYVWGVESQELYPGARVVKGSKRAACWADRLGIAFHEVLVESNSQAIGLVFSEVTVSEVTPGYAPFTVAASGHAEAYAGSSRQPLLGDLTGSEPGLGNCQLPTSCPTK